MRIRKCNLVCVLGAAIIAAIGSSEAAAVPSTMNYQGRLTDNSPQQNPITGNVEMAFSIWEQPTGGSPLWVEPASGTVTVSVNKGIFNVLLGTNGVPLPPSVFSGGITRYLEITVGEETLVPRQQIGSVAYAAQSEHSGDADQLAGQPSSSWQVRVTGSCPAGTAVGAINPDGSVTCNAGTPGPPGTTGQSATTVYATLSLTTGVSFVLIPGLTQTINVPSNSVAFISTDGNAQGSGCSVQIALFIDGVASTQGGVRNVTPLVDSSANPGHDAWSASVTRTLSPGMHTIDVRARAAFGCGGSFSTIPTGAGGSAQLTVLILKL